MTERENFEREVRDTVIKSGLTGVGAAVLVAAVCSPAGLGGLVGTSLASGFGVDPNAAPADDVYANLPAYPAPLSQQELTEIRGVIASTTASLEITRAATQERIEHVRALAMSDGVGFEPVRHVSNADGLRDTTAPTQIASTGSYGAPAVAYNDRHNELAQLLLAHEQF
ncbi:MAG: hypothetical protein AB7O98_11850 [Hyphomonadaceae bacterium]